MLCGATQDGQVMVESSDKMWSTGEGNGKPLQHSCLEIPMNSINVMYNTDFPMLTTFLGQILLICCWISVVNTFR